jgi:hypothetical protein
MPGAWGSGGGRFITINRNQPTIAANDFEIDELVGKRRSIAFLDHDFDRLLQTRMNSIFLQVAGKHGHHRASFRNGNAG